MDFKFDNINNVDLRLKCESVYKTITDKYLWFFIQKFYDNNLDKCMQFNKNELLDIFNLLNNTNIFENETDVEFIMSHMTFISNNSHDEYVKWCYVNKY